MREEQNERVKRYYKIAEGRGVEMKSKNIKDK